MEDKAQLAKGKILVLMGYYLPGQEAGGPIRSIANVIATLGQEYRFRVVTRDRDISDRKPYPGVECDRWLQVGNADVMYVRPGVRGLASIYRLLRALDQTTVLYLNSLLSQPFSILPILMRKFGLLRIKSVVLAPRGECSPGALGLKALKKRCYLNSARWLGLYRDVLWHASSDFEANDIQRQFQKVSKVEAIVAPSELKGGEEAGIEGEIEIANIIIASDIPAALRDRGGSRHVKTPGRLSVVFVSRVSPMKNLQAALQAFDGVQGDVTFDIYGPIEDAQYWEECQRTLTALPMNVRVRYRGTAKHESIAGTLLRYELFLLPSLGENFGHAICEALTVGLPVLISDRTPWRNLETAGVGWDISLNEPKRFREILQRCIDGDDAWYSAMSVRASRYAIDYCSAPEFINANRKLFDHSLARLRRYVTN